MAVEEEAGNRESSYEWGVRGLADTRGESCVIATNLALGARRTFRFSETITHDQTALKARDRSCPTSPHAQLAAMYLVFGEFQKCLSSLKALRGAPREADMKVQNEMVIKARFVELQTHWVPSRKRLSAQSRSSKNRTVPGWSVPRQKQLN